MNDASAEFKKVIDTYTLNTPKIAVYANYTAQPYSDNVADILNMQMKNPVRWQETIENMIKDGYTDFVEVGAGKTLSGLIKKISKDVTVYSVEDENTLNQTIEAINNR